MTDTNRTPGTPTRPSTFSLLGSRFAWETLPDSLPILEQFSCDTHQAFIALTPTGDRHLFLHLMRDMGDGENGPVPLSVGELRGMPEWDWMNAYLPAPSRSQALAPTANSVSARQ